MGTLVVHILPQQMNAGELLVQFCSDSPGAVLECCHHVFYRTFLFPAFQRIIYFDNQPTYCRTSKWVVVISTEWTTGAVSYSTMQETFLHGLEEPIDSEVT